MTTRLTAGGVVLALLGLAAAVAGAVAGYVELVVVAVVAAVALVAALVVPQIATPVGFERLGVPRLVPRGSTLDITLRALAQRRVISGLRIVDQVADVRVGIDLPPLAADRAAEVSYQVRVRTRGVHTVGPVLEQRSDPFGLAVRSIEHPVYDEVVVHPVVHRIRVTTGGDRERQRANTLPRISDDPLADFRALREYQPGDDPRTVHWASSARLGSLVVKDFLQLRRATRAVVLETLDSTIDAPAFEEAVDIAASLAVDAIEQAVVVTARTRDAAHPGSPHPVQRRHDVLDLLARVQRTPAPATLDPLLLRPRGETPDQLFLVMGARSPLLGVLAANAWTRQALVVVRVGSADRRQARPPRLPFPTLDVRSAREFATVARW